MELAQVEDEIEKLLNTLAGANAVLLSYANGKIEELDANRQRLIKEIAALNAETISPQKIETLSAHLENWDTIDFNDRRQVAESGPEAADRSENKAARVRIIDNVARHNLKNGKPFNHAN